MLKKILTLIIVLTVLGLGLFISVASASTVTGDLNTGLNSNNGNMDGVVIAAPTPSPTAGTYTSAQSVTLTAAGSTAICYTVDGSTPGCTNATTCSAGTLYSGAISVTTSKTIKSLACYNNNSEGPLATSAYTININSGGGGGGGGGSSVSYCTNVVFGNWNASCFGNMQYRDILTQTPAGCSLTTEQQINRQRTCSTETPVVTPVASETNGNVSTQTANVLADIAAESEIVGSNDTATLLSHLGNSVDNSLEQNGLIKYKKILGLDKTISETEKLTINDFIVYGTRSTQRLGAGERAAVINSYYQAYSKLPNTEAEWSDVLKIASGRWPSERSVAAENQAKIEFKKVYARSAVMTNNIDENAIMVIAYGLLPLQRNLNSEKVAILTFRWVYGHAPVSALAWNVVRAIAYSGATR